MVPLRLQLKQDKPQTVPKAPWSPMVVVKIPISIPNCIAAQPSIMKQAKDCLDQP